MVEISASAFLIMLSIKWTLKKKQQANRYIKLFCLTNDLIFFFKLFRLGNDLKMIQYKSNYFPKFVL